VENEKERDFLFDNIKGLLILCVVYAHFLRATTFDLGTWGSAIYSTFFCFIMQAFLFTSGYFSKKTDKCKETAIENFLFPYLILTVIMYIVRVLFFGWDNSKLHFIEPSMALWYLLVLFFYRYFIKDAKKLTHLLPLSILLSLLSGFVPFLNENLSLGRVFGFLPFFISGYLCTPEHIERIRQIPKVAIAPLLLILPVFGGIIAYTGIGWNSILFKRPYLDEGLTAMQGILERSALMLIAFVWIVVFIAMLPRAKTILSVAGQGTITVFVLHIIVRYGIKATQVFGQQNVYSYFCLFLCAVFVTWIFSRPLIVKLYQRSLCLLYNEILWICDKVVNSSRRLVLPRGFNH